MGGLVSVLLATCVAVGQAPGAGSAGPARARASIDRAGKQTDRAGGARAAGNRQSARERPADAAASPPEHAIEDLTSLVGRPAVAELASGEKLEGVEIASFAAGRSRRTFKSVAFKSKSGDKRRSVRSAALSRLEIGGQPYAVVFVPGLRGHVLIDLAARDAQINARLKTQGRQLWSELSDEVLAAAVAERKQFFTPVQAAYPGLRLHETRYFLFYTDLPEEKLAPFIRDLDAMYGRLAAAFGVPAGKNIWRGKAAIVMFVRQSDLWRFDQDYLKKPSSAENPARCHWTGDGDVTISGWVGSDPAFFAHLLVHETAHGFLARYRSNVVLPSWIDEGIADWIAEAVAPASGTTRRRQEQTIKALQKTASAGGHFFDARQVQRWQYGLASALVEYLLRIDSAAYRRFVDGIKEGATPEESLRAAYGMSPEELLTVFGRQIGVPHLMP